MSGRLQFNLPGPVIFSIPAAEVVRIQGKNVRARVFRGSLDALRSSSQRVDADTCVRLVSTVFPADQHNRQLELRVGRYTLGVSAQRPYYETERFVIVWERADAGDPYPSMIEEVMRMHKSALQ